MAIYDRAAILARQTQRKSERKEVNTRPMKKGEPMKPLQKVQKPIQRTPLKKSQKPIAKKSKKQIALDAIYSVLAKDFKKDHPKCEANLEGCTKQTTQVHHRAGRLGGNLTAVDTFLATCANCHKIIEENPTMAKEMGLSVSRLGKVQK